MLPVAADLWSYGDDVDGDGHPDLVAVEEDRLLVFLGSGEARSRRPISRDPRWILPLARPQKRTVEASISVGQESEIEEETRLDDPTLLTTVDLDGDGRAEIVVARAESGGSGLLEIFRLR